MIKTLKVALVCIIAFLLYMSGLNDGKEEVQRLLAREWERGYRAGLHYNPCPGVGSDTKFTLYIDGEHYSTYPDGNRGIFKSGYYYPNLKGAK